MSSSPNEQQVQEPEIKVEDKQKNLESEPCGWISPFCPEDVVVVEDREDTTDSSESYSEGENCLSLEKRNKKKSRKQKAKN